MIKKVLIVLVTFGSDLIAVGHDCEEYEIAVVNDFLKLRCKSNSTIYKCWTSPTLYTVTNTTDSDLQYDAVCDGDDLFYQVNWMFYIIDIVNQFTFNLTLYVICYIVCNKSARDLSLTRRLLLEPGVWCCH